MAAPTTTPATNATATIINMKKKSAIIADLPCHAPLTLRRE
jgi:hypothetical protein